MLFEQVHQFIVNVTDHVREHVDSGAQQILGRPELGCMNRDAQVVFVRLVDNRAVQLRAHRLDGAAAGVHPGLDQFHLARDQFPHGRARPGHGSDRKRSLSHVVGRDFGQWRQAAASRYKSCRVRILARQDVVADLEGHLAEIGPHALAGGNSGKCANRRM